MLLRCKEKMKSFVLFADALLSSTLLYHVASESSTDHFGPGGVCSNPYPTFKLSEKYQPLQQAPRIMPDDSGVTKVQLSLNLAYYEGPSYNTIMRTYNGMTPAPTIHVVPGGSLEIELINCLHPPLGLTGEEALNRFSNPNTTNLHTHGPHISGEDPGDNIFRTVEPQEVEHYKYDFPDNHMPGTHWYHPHFKGSTALQVGQGVAGMLIIDPPDDYPLPDYINDMPEINLLVQNINVPHLRVAADVSQDEVTDYIDHNFEMTGASTEADILMLVNMQFMPVVEMQADTWYRWRMGMSSIDKTIGFISDTGVCEFQLLAKDGVFLNDAPRAVDMIILSPGNRADIAVRCTREGKENMNIMGMRTDPALPLVPGYGGFEPGAQPVVFIVDVVKKADNLFDRALQQSNIELKPFSVPTPCYLVDLRDVDACDIETTFTNVYRCIPSPPWPGRQSPDDLCGVLGPPGDGGGGDIDDFFPFKNKDHFVLEFPVGTVQEILLATASFHPYHQHVNKFQIQAIHITTTNVTKEVGNWYQVGDWQDTLQLPNFQDAPETSVTIRFQSDSYTGRMPQHCHMLDHEDKGMMAVYNVYGKEGTIWPGAREINPTCILPSTNDSPYTSMASASGITDTMSSQSAKSSKDTSEQDSSAKASKDSTSSSKGGKLRMLGSTKSSKSKRSKGVRGKSRKCNKKIEYKPLPSYGFDKIGEDGGQDYV